MVRLNRITTKTGDDGETSLGDGTRVKKQAARIEVIGEIDEVNAVIGMARLYAKGEADKRLARIQNDLFDLGADICVPHRDEAARARLRLADSQVTRLETEISEINAKLKPLTSFILPGGSVLAAHLHLARTVVRRAERRLAALASEEKINPVVLRYVNRLSDHLFVAARAANANGRKDVLWKPGAER
jgi:cob(I)alamin adenosyltransferase